jgi:hypothetical protein
MSNLQAPSLTNTPSIASSAMLVELNISQWTARKKDSRASDEVTANKYADKGTASVSKKLLGNCPELDAIKKFATAARTTHYSMTMPWSDNGLRLLPTTQYAEYHNEMTRLQNEFAALVTAFTTKYEWEVVHAQAKLGDLFLRDDYPTTESIERKFDFRMAYIPLPEAGDFRVDVGNEQREVLETHYSEYYTKQIESAMGDVWQRVHKALSAISDRLDEPTADDKTNKRGHKIFRESLVDNALSLLPLLSTCNVTGDSQMEALRLRLDDTLRGVTYDSLSHSSVQRAQTKRAADDMLASLPTLDW